MSYLLIKILHLGAAAFFIGGVFFEVMIVSRASRQLSDEARAQLSFALGVRARKVMHWVVLVLYGAGIALAWNYRGILAQPFASSFSFLLSLKIAFALSILGHFIFVVWLLRTGRATPWRSKLIHYSVLTQMLIIVVLAKSMMFAW
ncbi:CopD family copper resistance protein [Pseudomonas sp.]|uniref:CopD family copper resistance protein n=1 Tax=Pseudomonas sp. TaxID=306 RepID=UPI003A976BFB